MNQESFKEYEIYNLNDIYIYIIILLIIIIIMIIINKKNFFHNYFFFIFFKLDNIIFIYKSE